jgi:autotransporter-associated beta strand protein
MELLSATDIQFGTFPVSQVWKGAVLLWNRGFYWNGLGADNNWSTANNWSNATTPIANSFLTFAGTTRLSPFNDFVTDTTFGAVTFNSNAGTFQLAGNKLIIGNSGFTNNSTNTQTINNNVVLSPGNNIVNCTSGPITFAGALSGTGSIVKNGSSTLTYSGVSTYTGQTIINQGTLTVTSASTLNGVISGEGSLEKRGVNILTIGGNNTYSGGTSYFSAGLAAYIVYNSSNAFGTGIFTLFNNAGRIDSGNNVTLPNDFLINSTSLQYRTIGANTITVTGNISGIGGINKTGNGLLDLQGTLTYTDDTTITAGTIRAYKTVGAVTATASFTNTTLTVSFNTPPSIGDAFRFFSGSTVQTYASISLIGAPGRTASYNSSISTLTIDS